MRLINVETLRLKNFVKDIPKYAILSHTWEGEEVTFQDYDNITTRRLRKGWRKIEYACQQAKSHGLKYVWVDTACIDKSSSAELSEAINSMFEWYQEAEECYVYLVDVERDNVDQDLARSRWFLRGWTLQELLAPTSVLLFDQDWQFLGDKSAASLGTALSTISGIPGAVLHDAEKIDHCSIAQRMSWASERETTRIEDTAYCLLGLFRINMPLLYGEGNRAFVRLQEEILKTSYDQTLLAWGFNPTIRSEVSWGGLYIDKHTLFAWSPADFKNSGLLKPTGRISMSYFTLLSHGFKIHLPVIDLGRNYFIGLLGCQNPDSPDFIGIQLECFPKSNTFKRLEVVYGVSNPSAWVSTRTVPEDLASHAEYADIHITPPIRSRIDLPFEGPKPVFQSLVLRTEVLDKLGWRLRKVFASDRQHFNWSRRSNVIRYKYYAHEEAILKPVVLLFKEDSSSVYFSVAIHRPFGHDPPQVFFRTYENCFPKAHESVRQWVRRSGIKCKGIYADHGMDSVSFLDGYNSIQRFGATAERKEIYSRVIYVLVFYKQSALIWG